MISQELSGQPSPEPELEAVLEEFDTVDVMLQMAYARYIDRPTEARLQEVRGRCDDLIEAFANLLRETIMGSDPIFDETSRNVLIVLVLATVNNEHAKCIAEYTDSVEVYSEDELARVKQGLVECLEDTPLYEGEAAYVSHVVSHLSDILESDWEAIETVLDEHRNRPHRRVLRQLGETAKIAAAAAVGVMIADRLRQR